MKRLVVLLLVLCTAGVTRGQGTSGAGVEAALRHLDEGNRRYVEGDYRGALQAYEQALAAGYESGTLYLNMGNAYYRLDRLGEAIRHYAKARRLMPGDRVVQHNLRIAQNRAVDRFSRVPDPFWRVAWERAVATVGPRGFFVVGLLGYLVAMVLLGVRVWRGPRGPWHRRALTLAALVAVVGLAAAFGAALEGAEPRAAVVLVDEAALREAPGDTASVALIVHEGLLVDLLERQGPWVAVRLPNGATGWLPADTLGDV
ncbi:MAG: tetratricopeptide repeat protein [Bacteroidetes bacterium]|nr:MAG: tetratricopeptide repeat protein [Bacteroidota bacterium]